MGGVSERAEVVERIQLRQHCVQVRVYFFASWEGGGEGGRGFMP